jgi:hypothetical protein
MMKEAMVKFKALFREKLRKLLPAPVIQVIKVFEKLEFHVFKTSMLEAYAGSISGFSTGEATH